MLEKGHPPSKPFPDASWGRAAEPPVEVTLQSGHVRVTDLMNVGMSYSRCY